ncbi:MULTISPECIES: ABC transporter ATP-binding protein [Caproicibacterium]|uniref:ATP-binding cassette domain-containing protein n=1 Tax=Caproicibacterium argilliputei TaxID=3030016 RepID=A0AA97DCS4_9FIRM|nr:ATP-binding cassette domain-containing protein [Caproicibacterium argilliputei]WOC33100.1 ATP-binding cassette domain-containing protein [Caproicibacterium argilliputei]
MEEMMIKVEHVEKQFKEVKVLKDINVCLERGKIHGLIGRNGSGKTVLMKCICGFMKPTAGSITVAGKRVGKDVDIPQNLGVIIEAPGFLPGYSGFKNLKFLADIQKKADAARITEVMERVGLDPASKKHVSKYSLGMRQRLGIAQAIMEDPDLLILDEPMNGLDNHGVEDIRALLLSLKEEGKTILIASHSAEDIAVLCDTVHEMDAGVLTSAAEA